MTTTAQPHAAVADRPVVSSRRLAVGPIVAAAGLLIGVAPLCWHFGRDLIARGEYAVFVMFVAAGVLLSRRLAELPDRRFARGSWWVAMPLFAAAAACLVGGMIFYLRWAAAPAVAVAAVAVAFRIGGTRLLGVAGPSVLLVFLAVPPPSMVANPLLITLQKVAVFASSRVFDILGLPNVRTGTVIAIPGHRLLVEEACSGINSLTAIVAFSLLYAFLAKRSAVRATVLTAVGAGMALATNVIRIVVGGFILGRFKLDLFDPGVHAWIGLAMFAVSIALVFSADHLLVWLVPIRKRRPIEAGDAEPTRPTEPKRPTRDGPAVAYGAIGIAFLAIGLTSADRLYGCWPSSKLSADAAFVAPPTIGPWTLDSDPNARPTAIASLNVQNYTWTYRNGEHLIETSFTFPFAHGVHDSTICYAVTGWDLSNRRIDDAGQYTTVDLASPGPVFGKLYFATFDENGDWQPPIVPPSGKWASQRIAFEQDVARRSPGYELQVLALSQAPIAADDRAAALELFQTLRSSLRKQMLKQVGEPVAEGGR